MEKRKANELSYAKCIEDFSDPICKLKNKKQNQVQPEPSEYIIDGGEWDITIVNSPIGKFYKHSFSYNGKSGYAITKMGELSISKVDSEAAEITESVFFTNLTTSKKNDVWRNTLLPPKIRAAHSKPEEKIKLIDLFDFPEVEEFYSFMVDLADMASRWIFQRNPNSPFCTKDAVCISVRALLDKNKVIKKLKNNTKLVLKNFPQRRVEEVNEQNLSVIVIPYSFYREEEISCTIIDNPEMLEGIE